MNMKKCLYIMEGETEKRFLEELKANNWIISGRTRKYNLMQNRIKPTDSIVAMKYALLWDSDWNLLHDSIIRMESRLYSNMDELFGFEYIFAHMFQDSSMEDESILEKYLPWNISLLTV